MFDQEKGGIKKDGSTQTSNNCHSHQELFDHQLDYLYFGLFYHHNKILRFKLTPNLLQNQTLSIFNKQPLNFWVDSPPRTITKGAKTVIVMVRGAAAVSAATREEEQAVSMVALGVFRTLQAQICGVCGL